MGYATKDTRERAVAAYKSGKYTQQQVGAMFGVHYKTIVNWVRCDAEGREQIPLKRGHPPRILTEDDHKVISTVMEANPSTTINELMAHTGKVCSPSVYSRALAKLGLTYKKNLKRR